MMSGVHQLLNRLECREGATKATIAEIEGRLNTKLPDEYVEFLTFSNGYEGFVGKKSYVMLWTIEELPSMNQAYEVNKYAPGLLLIGSDGGGEAFGFDTRTSQLSIVQIPFVGMSWSAALPLALSFESFIERLHGAE